MPQQISPLILPWFKKHGRHSLPWQLNKSFYHVWLSEVMLQQTQVKTMIPYFERFITEFKDISELAHATEDEVLHLWTGLGYYARARNLHKSAQTIMSDYRGQFPTKFDEVLGLTGVGRSTAGAILSSVLNQNHPILDGNVKRVLTRLYCIDGHPSIKNVENKLWAIAQEQTPENNACDYNQAMMDLGALICTRTKPQCALCPLTSICLAYKNETQTDYPSPKKKKDKPIKQANFYIYYNHTGVFLIKQPTNGIWGGLYCFPQQPIHSGSIPSDIKKTFRHTFSHYHLDITPIFINIEEDDQNPQLGKTLASVHSKNAYTWFSFEKNAQIGLAQPVKSLILELMKN